MQTEVDELLAIARRYCSLIESLDDGEVWYEQNAYRMFMPASNQKILIAATALEVLGPEFTYTTRLYQQGEIRGEVLEGNLVVQANGDPTVRRTEGEPKVRRLWL